VSDKEDIERRRAEYVAAFNREDIDAMAEYAAPDTPGMAPNRPAIKGLEAHLQMWADCFSMAKSRFYVYPEELDIAGDVAVDRHRWALDSMPKRGGRPVHDEGKGIWIWRRQPDGQWKVARGIWNSDLSRPGFQVGPGARVSGDLASINKLLDDFIRTVNEGDLEGWGELMTDDFIFAVPDQPKFVGKPTALAAAKMGYFDPFNMKLASRFDDVQIFGSQAFAHGSFTFDLMPKAGGPGFRTPGKFSNFFRKDPDGSWHFALVIFSYDQAPYPIP